MSLWYPGAPGPLVERQGLFLCQSAKVGLEKEIRKNLASLGFPLEEKG